MAQFDPEQYFASRLSNMQPKSAALTDDVTFNKLNAIQTAAQDKQTQLMEKVVPYLQQQEQLEQNSWVGSLGLDPEGFAGSVLNLGASAVSGSTRIIGNIASGLHAAQTAAIAQHVPDEVREARARQLRGEATEEDMKMLSLPAGDIAEPEETTAIQRIRRAKAETNLQRIQRMEESIQDGKYVHDTMDVSSIVHPRAREELTASLRSTYNEGMEEIDQGNVVAGVGQMLVGIGAGAITNPQGSLEYITENLPQIVLASQGAAGISMTNLPYALDAFGQGLSEYQKKHGRMPSEAEMQEMGVLAASLMAAETVGDKLVLGAGKVGKVLGKAPADEAVKQGFKESVLNTGKAALAGGAAELATEAYQTWAEEQIKGNDASGEEIFIGGSIGAIAGAGNSAGMRAAAEVVGATPEKAKEQQQAATAIVELEQAIQAGDATPFLDPAAQTYDPVKGLSVLYGNSQLDGTTEEQKVANQEQANEVIEQLETKYTTLKEGLDQFAPETVAQQKAQLTVEKKALADLDPASPEAQKKQMLVDLLEEAVTEAEAKPADEIRQNKLELARTERMLSESRKVKMQFDAQPEPDLQADVAVASSEVDTQDVQAVATARQSAERVLTLSMQNSPSVEPAMALQIANNLSNGLSDEQRGYLRQFSEARTLANQAKGTEGVRQEILYGNKAGTMLGVEQYRREVGAAVRLKDRRSADRYLGYLTRFAEDHRAKETAMAEAYDQMQETGQSFQAIKSNNGWEVIPRNLPDAVVQRNGGFTFNPSDKGMEAGKKQVTAVRTEAELLGKTLQELQSSVALSFGSPVIQAATPSQAQSAQSTSVDSQAPVAQEGKNQVFNIGGQDPYTVSFEHKEDGRLVRTITYPDGESSIEMLSTDKNGDEFWVSQHAYEKGEFYPRQLSSEEVRAAIKEDNDGRAVVSTQQPTQVSAPVQQVSLGVVAPTVGTEASANPKSVGLPRITVGKADGWLNANAQASRDQADMLGLTSSIESLFAEGLTAQQVGSQLVKEGKLDSIPMEDRIGFIINTRATLGIPSQMTEEGKAEFAAWKETRDARGSAVVVATPSQLEPTVVDSEAAPAAVAEQTEVPSNQSNVDSTVDSVPSEPSTSPEAQAAPASTESTTDSYSESTEVASSDLAETAEQNTLVAVEAPVEETKIEAGKLATFEQRSKEQKPFRLRNLIADFFAQNSRTEGTKTLNPLVQVKDFLSQWEAGKVRATEFLALDSLSEKQMDVLTLFREKAKKWAPIFQKNLSKNNDPAYNYNDMMQFLLQSFDVDGKTQLDLEENIKTAMSYAAFSWIGEQASRNSQNSKEEINQILGKDEAHEVTDEQWGRLANAGTRENVVRNALGQRAVAALGLKALKNAPQGLQAKLESVMGVHIEAMLEEQGLIEVDLIPDAEMAMLSGREVVNNKIQHRFLSVARENGKPVYSVQQIYSATTGTQGVLDDLFSVESALKEPSLKPIPFVQKLAKNSRQRVPKFLAKILEKANSEANYLREDSWGIFNQLDTEALDTIAGVEEVYEDRMHKARRKSVEAKNDGLRREVDRIFDFVEGTLIQVGLDHPMYFDHVVWKQQRVGIATNMINPQTSKVHRFLLYRKAWETKVDPNNAAQLQNFQLRVLEGLGEKTGEQANEVTLAKFEAKINDPKIRAAVDAIVTLQQGTPMNEQLQEAIVQGVKKGSKKMHSFDALMALAHQKNANGAPFTVYMMGEVDGVTNGPMLSHLALGAASSVKGLFALLNKGGFYQEGSQYTQYNLWRGSENKMDLYETTASHMMEAASALLQKTPALRPVLNAVYAFTGNLRNEETGKIEKDGRNIVKTPLTAMIFGSSLNKAVDSMADAFIESIYKKIETLTKKDFKHDRVAVIRQLNVLLGSLRIPENTPVEQLLEMDFSESKYLEHRKVIKKAFKDSLGQAVKNTMARDFALFEERRTAVNSTARMTFALYDGVYQALREGFIAEEVKAGKLETDGAGRPIQELTIEQENQLRERLARMAPVIHTYMSKKGSLDEGLTMSKNERTLSDRPTYASEPRIAGKTTLTRGYETRDIDPGVAMGVMSIHSADSAISHIAAALSEVLNIHDAHGAGLGMFEQTARNLNEATWKVLLEFSPAREMYNAMVRTIQNMAAMQERGELPVSALQAVADNLANIQVRMKEEERPPLEQMLRLQLLNMDANAREADKIKLEAMAQMIAVDQYALEGGNFVVTEEHRAAAKAKLADLPTTTPSADLMALATLEEALEPYLQEKKASKEADEAFDKADVSNIPAVEAMQVLEQMLAEPEFDERTEANLRQVLTKMWAGTRNLKEAIKSVATGLEAVSLLSLVMEAHTQIPTDRWFPLGKPANESDSLFVNALSVRGEISLDQALELIGRRVSKLPENQKQFNQRLMALLKRTVNKDLKIKMITPATLPEAVLKKGADKSRGWYALKGDQEGIYVLSPAFRDSQITWDLLMHELVHAALTQAVEDAKTNLSKPAAELVTELETLLEKARELAAGTQYEAATANVHELLAWGLSNEGFQRDVLSKISMESKNKNNALLNGFQKFVEAITNFLFKSFQKPVSDQNGLGVLITNASGLFAHAATTRVAGNLVLNQMSATQQVRSYSTLDLFNALGNPLQPISSEFESHLQEVLDRIVNKLHGPFGSFKESLMKDQVISPLDVWAKALNTGEAPFAAQINLSSFRVSEQERFVIEQVEATVRAALTDKTGNTTAAATELSKLYQEARRRLKVSDFAKIAGNADAQKLYDFVFKMEKVNGDMTDHLSRFAAMGMAHEGMRKLLDMQTERNDQDLTNLTFTERLSAIFERILSWFNGKLTHTYAGQQADAKLTMLVEQLVQIESRRRLIAERKLRAIDWMGPIEEKTKAVVDATKKKIESIASTTNTMIDSVGVVRGTKALVRTWAGNRVDLLGESLIKLRDKHLKERHGMLVSLISEAKGPREVMQFLLRITKLNERNRKREITRIAKETLAFFKDGGAYLTEEAKAALSQVLVRPGAFSLLARFDMNDVQRFIEDRTQRTQAIQQLEQELAAFPDFQHYYMNQAKALAYFRVTGEVVNENLMMNAHNIANLYGTAQTVDVVVAKQAEQIIDLLVPLYALNYSSKKFMDEVREVLRIEAARGEGKNGVEATLRLHENLDKESRERNFQGQKTLMMKGYVPEIYNPNVSVEVADAVAGAELEARGYVEKGSVQRDPNDPDQTPLFLYEMRDAGLAPHLTGAISYTGEVAKGSKKYANQGYSSDPEALSNASANALRGAKHANISRLFNAQPYFDPAKVPFAFMAPVLNDKGQVTNYRYLMQEDTKDALLNRNNRFEQLMGALAGSIVDKETTTEQNTKVLESLKEIYDKEFKKNPSSFVHINHNAADPEMREMYALLPAETRKAIKAIWGSNGMMVQYEMLDIVFGYRKLTLSSMFEKERVDREGVEKFVGDVVEKMLYGYARVKLHKSVEDAEKYKRRAAMIIRRGENIWQEVVKEVKDIIVVKSTIVLLGNITSNFSLLIAEGVGISDMIRHHRVALKGATAYLRDTEALHALQTRLATGFTQGNDAEIQHEITRLEDAIARNPVKELIDAGLMPTIVEDVAIEDDLYSYKAAFTRKVDELTQNVNPRVLSVAKQIYMTHDTGMYQFLSRTTQLSDFVARYTLFQHLTTRKRDPLSRSDAIQRASDSFVNYDIPMQRQLQYLDDMGVMMFTKYFLRIQRVLFRLVKEHPLQMLMMVGLHNYLGGLPIVTDSMAVTRIGNNPLDIGALNYPFTLDDLGTVQATMSLLK